ncbi:MAG: cobalamin-dependent protein [Planctomycetota bacterium]|jgi:methylmalonyl-CoA mutase C-terminal domain/subunit|nr:cobalamin-dependent protein [Planctomycetota bacterium]
MSETNPTSRPIRVLIAKPGLDGHDVGAKIVCRALMDAGMEVIYSGLRQSPAAIVKSAVEEDVDVLGLSVLSGAHIPLCEQLREQLERHSVLGRVTWMVGGNIPHRDFDALSRLGVAGIFPTGTHFDDIVKFIQCETRP